MVPMAKQVALTAFINLREGRLPSEFNERQARVLMGIEHPKLNNRGKVDKCWALDRLSKEFGLDYEVFADHIELIADTKKCVKELRMKLSNTIVDETLEQPCVEPAND